MLSMPRAEKGMAPFVYETERPHLNEAALLAGTNPELDAAEAQHRNRAGARNYRHAIRSCNARSIWSPRSKFTRSARNFSSDAVSVRTPRLSLASHAEGKRRRVTSLAIYEKR